MAVANENELNRVQQWVEKKMSPETIKEELKLKGFTAEEIEEKITAFRKLRYEKRKFAAFLLMGIGAFVGFISCVLTVTNILPHMFDVFLYGLTTLAALLVFRGLYLVFEG